MIYDDRAVEGNIVMEHPYIQRLVDLPEILGRKSYFLFGPRQTGKTLLIHHTLKDVPVYDLLDSSTYLSLSQNPGRLSEQITGRDGIVVIDEIQRIPDLLNEVHRLIEERGVRFLLTGSSARKLRRGGVNLLGGRARIQYLHPLSCRELGAGFELSRAAERGLLPSIYFSDDPGADLEAYVGTYLQQEIAAEGATRNIPAFGRFLKTAALCNGKVVNFTNVASDSQVPRTTVHEYFEILRDTLVMHEVPAWRKSRKRKPLVSSKYFFFDVGVVSALQGRMFRMDTPEFGEAFETLVFQEIIAWSDYRSGEPVSHWRSTSGYEVHFIIGDHTAVEVKAGRNMSSRDLRSLRALTEEARLKRYLCVCREERPRQIEGITVLPWKQFFDGLWNGEYTG